MASGVMPAAADLVVDLTDAVNADPEWKAMYNETWESTDCRDGRIYASSSEGQLIGYYYNSSKKKAAAAWPPKCHSGHKPQA